jgi:hypothetical protein
MIAQVGRGVVKPYHFFNLSAGWKWAVYTTLLDSYPLERKLVPTVQEIGWASV